MNVLVVEDDFASRKFMMNYMSKFGDCDGTVDGSEAVEAYMMATEAGEPYDLICLDVMMPVMDGYQVLKTIREIERQKGVAVVHQRLAAGFAHCLVGSEMDDRIDFVGLEQRAACCRVAEVHLHEFGFVAQNTAYAFIVGHVAIGHIVCD